MNGRYYVGEWLVEPEQNRVVRGSETATGMRSAKLLLAFTKGNSRESIEPGTDVL